MQASVLRRLDAGPVGRTVQAILFSRSVLALGAVLLGLAMTDYAYHARMGSSSIVSFL